MKARSLTVVPSPGRNARRRICGVCCLAFLLALVMLVIVPPERDGEAAPAEPRAAGGTDWRDGVRLVGNRVAGRFVSTATAAATVAVQAAAYLPGGTDGTGGAVTADGGALIPLPSRAAANGGLGPRTRECGSPAVDGYAHVNSTCLEGSRTFREAKPSAELENHTEEGADYDGLAVRWGIGHTKQNAAGCAAACLAHIPSAKPAGGPGDFSRLPCNAWTWCGNPAGCFTPDAHKHSFGDCWLKFTEVPESPEVNMRGNLSPEMRARHPKAPPRCEWWAGVLLPRGMAPSNGTAGPRANW